MRQGLHSKFVAALLAPALILAAGAQSMLFMRCAQDMHACCRPKQQASPALSMPMPGARECCDRLSTQQPPATTHEAAVTAPPTLVALPGEAPQPVLLAVRAGLEPPPLQHSSGPPITISHCALLI